MGCAHETNKTNKTRGDRRADGRVCVNETQQETVFQCLGSWVRHVNVPGDDLVRNPLLPAAFDALGNQELFETAVDLLVEVRIYGL